MEIQNPMKSLFFLSLILTSFCINAQSDQIIWQKTLGGTSNDVANKIKPTSDGGYIVCGHTESKDGDVHDHHGNFFTDAWFVKLDEFGDTIWTHAYGGTYDETAQDIVEIPSGGYMTVVYSVGSSGGDISTALGGDDFWVLRLASNGDIVWEKTFGGSGYDTPTSIINTYDDQFVVSGHSASQDGDISNPVSTSYDDAWFFKMDIDGNIIWDKSLGGTDTDKLLMLKETADSGFVLTGNTWSNDVAFTNNQGSRDAYIIKTDSLGNFEWGKTYGGTGNDYSTDIIESSQGNIIITGYTTSNNGDFAGNLGSYDVFLIDVDNLGTINWVKNYGGGSYDIPYGLIETMSNNYTVVGLTGSNDGNVSVDYLDDEMWIFNFDQSGDIIWENSFGGDSVDVGYSIMQNTDGTYAVAGYTASNEIDVSGIHGTDGYSDFWVVKLGCAPTVEQPICLVTVDNTSSKNIVVWEKPANNIAIDSFYIYRDIIGTYTKIGAVHYDSLSQFVDTTNGVNPNITSYRYKVSAVDTCGLEGPLSDFHETIHLTTNPGTGSEINLIWDNYEGLSFAYYRIWSDSLGDGQNWQVIDSVTSANTTYTDLTPATPNAGYMIEVIPPAICSATKAQDHNSTRSNRAGITGGSNSVDELGEVQFMLYPNPTSGKVLIQLNQNENAEILIRDLGGRLVQKLQSNQSNFTIDISNFENGIYFLTVQQGEYSSTKRIIKN